MGVKIAAFTICLCLTGVSSSLMAASREPRDLLKIDPYSVESVEKYFPEAIEIISVVQKPEDHHYLKTTGPHLKQVKKIHYEVLIPHMISLMQEQHQMSNK